MSRREIIQSKYSTNIEGRCVLFNHGSKFIISARRFEHVIKINSISSILSAELCPTVAFPKILIKLNNANSKSRFNSTILQLR